MKLLKMIESVDKDDTDTLDEIDARMKCYLDKNTFDFIVCTSEYIQYAIKVPEGFDAHIYPRFLSCKQYTRSRDALKAIRPEGWFIQVKQDRNRFSSHLRNYPFVNCRTKSGEGIDKTRCFESKMLPTEEWAELYSILLVIEWERNNDT